MKRRYLCVGVASFVTGVIMGTTDVRMLIIAFVVLAGLGRSMLLKKKMSILIFAFLLLAGGLYGHYADNKTTPLDKYIQTPCEGELFVTDIESLGEYSVVVKAEVTKVGNEKINEPILFTIFGITDIDVNKRIKFENLKFRIPEDARNDGGFDYRRYLKSQGIYHIASAKVENLKASGDDGFVVLKFFRTLKQKFARRCEKVWGESYATGIIPAILTGNDILLDGEIKDLFSGAGITHILVASGMHVAVVILIFSIILYPLRGRRKLHELLLGAAIVCFALLVGYTPSIVRVLSSLFIYYLARKLLRSADPVTVLFEAMMVIIVINPMSIYGLSFQLSFSAVFGIIMFTPHITERFNWFLNAPCWVFKLPPKVVKKIFAVRNFIINAAAVSVSAQLGVLPFMVIAFGGSSVFAVLINIIIALIIPLIYGFGITAVIFNIEPFVAVTKWLCDALVDMARFTIQIPGNYMSFPQSNIIVGAITCFVLACLLRCKVKKFTPFFEPMVLVCAIVVLIACPLTTYIPQNKAEVTFLNVGQGDCAIVRLADNKTVVIDTGTINMCLNELVPFLDRKNITKIDMLIVSHEDIDHAGGVQLLSESVLIDKVVTSKFYDSEIKNTNHLKCEKGEKFDVGNAKFEILSPDRNYKNDNNNSLVVRMDFGESSFLFMGDAGDEVEKEMKNVDADVLKVSHHGAKSASSEEFLQKVSPEYSVISVDKDNTYGHPDENVLKRLENVSDAVFRTDRDKTITITADLEGNLNLTKRLQASIINNRK